jgi:gluconate kinase
MAARLDHFMPPGLLDSQFEALEQIEPDENAIVLNLIADKTPQEEADEIIRRLGLRAEDRGSTSMPGGTDAVDVDQT